MLKIAAMYKLNSDQWQKLFVSSFCEKVGTGKAAKSVKICVLTPKVLKQQWNMTSGGGNKQIPGYVMMVQIPCRNSEKCLVEENFVLKKLLIDY